MELLILDEFQHFQDRDSHKVLRTVSDWLKLLMDETGIPIVLVGCLTHIQFLDADGNEQLQRRFGGRIELEAFRYNTSKERQDFRRFLNVIDEKLPLAEKSDLADPSIALCIFEATNGVIGTCYEINTTCDRICTGVKSGKADAWRFLVSRMSSDWPQTIQASQILSVPSPWLHDQNLSNLN